MRCKCFGTGVVLWGNRGSLVLRCKCSGLYEGFIPGDTKEQ